jgi:hypothetical protein
MRTSVLFLAFTASLFAQGLPPRTAPTEYQTQAKAGTVTLAAEFVRHSVPTAQGTLSTEDYVVVELAMYGPPDTRTQLSLDDFSLRINGKKQALKSVPYGMVLASIKDPEWVPPESASSGKGSKGGLTGGGGGGNDKDLNAPPPVVKVPLELQRAMAQHTQKAAIPLGDRTLPVAGLLFFPYRGKEKNITSVELIYSGAAGQATLNLQP